MCPTGALKIKKDAEGTGLLFNSSLCIGCGLCRDFCRMEAVTVSKGFAGIDYFQFGMCNAEAYAPIMRL
jgi:formate hydrogenlyase subunit 6/NADH:ubiquinone oxidoreductase subunit I